MNFRHILIPSLLFSMTFASAETPKLKTLFKSLENFPQADAILQDLMGRLLRLPTVHQQEALAPVLGKIGLLPDFDNSLNEPIAFYHGYEGDTHWYLVVNGGTSRKSFNGTFRVSNKRPEIWNPETGGIQSAPIWKPSSNGRTEVQLDLTPGQSVFVIFKPMPDASATETIAAVTFKPDKIKDDGFILEKAIYRAKDDSTFQSEGSYRLVNGKPFAFIDQPGQFSVTTSKGSSYQIQSTQAPVVLKMKEPWSVKFGRFGPEGVVPFASTTNWAQHEDKRIKYFSGTAQYTTSFQFTKAHPNQPIELDLGVVHDVAVVTVNGKTIATLWKPPFRLDVTPFLINGTNQLQVNVTNTIANRMIGDEQHPEQGVDRLIKENGGRNELKSFPDWVKAGLPNPDPNRKTFSTNKFWKQNSPLQDSGLLGPVRLITPVVVPLSK